MKINPFAILNENDEYFTPSYVIYQILEFINAKWIIWCPFDDGNSEFVKILNKNGNKVIYSHIRD